MLVLQEAWRQCDRHMHHMLHALAALRGSLPLSPQSAATLDDEAVQDWDQFILRFTKLQDAMGARFFPPFWHAFRSRMKTGPCAIN